TDKVYHILGGLFMTKTRIAINGFGRIGRMVFRQAILDENIEVVAINASYPEETLAHLMKYDSVHGVFECDIQIKDNTFEINGQQIIHCNSREPEKLPWAENDIDVVIEATGKFKTNEEAGRHLQAGAKKVVITAPGKDVDNTIVLGVNDSTYNKFIVLCKPYWLYKILKVLDDKSHILNGLITTVHAFTSDQQRLDKPHKDSRRARACGQSIILTSTGAAKALGTLMPHLNGKLHGMALRVPTPNVSLVDLVVDVEDSVTVEEVNEAFKEASQQDMKGIIQYSDEPLVSIDYNTNDASAIIDGLSTIVMGDNKVKVLAWYDNEWGYSARVLDLARFVGKNLNVSKDQREKIS